ncbi:cystathionine beta-lyase [Sphingomonas naphthae]|uniref:Cystathionine beta-lyase n=1 Tax=Sphingomonas naphthae TaxID=1813468 RepID=A0ABY7TK33_9SPHN|nr:cystathionine beta-lyase [Sphingomonas naphthae]WCT73565.1 cystathionine beta-lyase [Sphingomonas naphthae]
MSKGRPSGDLRPATKLVVGGRRPEWTNGVVNAPVIHASTILFDSVAALREAETHPDRGLYYGRRGTPTQWSLAEALTDLEPGAEATLLYPSGVAAISTALLSVLKPGDELLMVDSTYAPTRFICDGLLKSIGVTTRYYDPSLGAADVAALFGDRTCALFLESPGSLTFEVQDVPGLCAAARAAGVVTLLDNTWATPLLFPAIGHGVDLTILAATKYIVGHSDVMLGSVTATAARMPALRRMTTQLGHSVAPDDAYLAARGLRTLGVRLKAHGENGLIVARWLADQPQVAKVLHPALPDCPGHALFARDFAGASGLFTILLDPAIDDAGRVRFVDTLELFGIGFSWGGFESLALPIDPESIRTARPWAGAGLGVRLHIGLEDPADLIADLGRALAAI